MPIAHLQGRLGFWRAVTVCAILLFSVGIEAQTTGSAEVELSVRGPDGGALANAWVRVRPTSRPVDGAEVGELVRRTDAAGRLAFRWPIGVVAQMTVRAGDLGYGYVGTMEVVPGQVNRRALPPLVAFGRIEGAVPPELAQPGAVLTVYNYRHSGDEQVTPEIRGDRYAATVPAGDWFASVMRAGTYLAVSEAAVVVAPGQTVKAPALRPPPPRDDDEWLGGSFPRVRPAMRHWAQGTVRDDAGRPVAAANVYAVAEMSGSIRRYEQSAATVSDAAGHYQIGFEGPHDFSVMVVAHVPGHAPAIAWGNSYGAEPAAPTPATRPATRAATAPVAPPTIDLTIPGGGGGGLVVTVRRAGKPVADVPVCADPHGHYFGGQSSRRSANQPEAGQLNALVRPTVATDADGVARFDHLLPGLYDLRAAVPPDLGDLPRGRPVPLLTPVDHVSPGVPVRPGEVTAHSMTLGDRAARASFKILRPDGQPLRPTASFTYAARCGDLYANAIEHKGDGVYDATFPAAGLWRVSFTYRDSGVDAVARVGPGAAPYNEAVGVVVASSVAAAGPPATFTVVRRPLGSLAVTLRDAAGRPARGAVEVSADFRGVQAAGSVDADGVVRFEGLPSGKYIVRPFVQGDAPFDLGGPDAPLPDAGRLAGRSATLGGSVQISDGADERIVLRAAPVAFVYGTWKPAAGRAAAEYFASAWSAVGAPSSAATPSRYRAATGEFVAGPFPPGPVHVGAYPVRRAATYDPDARAQRTVTAEAGRATRVDLTPADRPAEVPGFNVYDARPSHLTGRVVHADGKTPALAARVMMIGPDAKVFTAGLTDAGGAIREYGFMRFLEGDDGVPIEPVVIAWLPGACGPVVVPISGDWRKPWSLTLPRPAVLRGKVTVAGAAPGGGMRRIRVVAGRPGGAGRLDAFLAVEATVEPDGSFELAGLPPGENEIQAALDGVWVSRSVTVRVGEDTLDPIALDVPRPGGAVTVRVVDAAGAAVVGRDVSVERPPGPLTRELWPVVWTTDGAGVAHIPAVEAGKHRLTIPGTAWGREINVGGGSKDEAVEVEARLK